jgi:hypothetical protein
LPRDIRSQLAGAIGDGIPGYRLVAWLNSLPEVQAILAHEFGGRPIDKQNLSKWKTHAYPDWLQEQAFMQATLNLLAKNGDKLGEALSATPPHDPPSTQS